ncbi:hypothetical protein PC110_g1411 [Phytophthora cactorum]|uniref:Uncharacterized protein n=1 Tax=Phytophthora cactorum TaxID=29920 RepID=A0A329T0S0_9STRA|nr:hypothetical protein PC110_g1411 [Phytophthora cactorum]
MAGRRSFASMPLPLLQLLSRRERRVPAVAGGAAAASLLLLLCLDGFFLRPGFCFWGGVLSVRQGIAAASIEKARSLGICSWLGGAATDKAETELPRQNGRKIERKGASHGQVDSKAGREDEGLACGRQNESGGAGGGARATRPFRVWWRARAIELQQADL